MTGAYPWPQNIRTHKSEILPSTCFDRWLRWSVPGPGPPLGWDGMHCKYDLPGAFLHLLVRLDLLNAGGKGSEGGVSSCLSFSMFHLSRCFKTATPKAPRRAPRASVIFRSFLPPYSVLVAFFLFDFHSAARHLPRTPPVSKSTEPTQEVRNGDPTSIHRPNPLIRGASQPCLNLAFCHSRVTCEKEENPDLRKIPPN
jgi:hypothetical protein